MSEPERTTNIIQRMAQANNMPTISEVIVSRKFNLGNYEMIEVSWHAYVAESEDPKRVTGQLEQGILQYMREAHPEALNLKTQTTSSKPKLRTIEDVKKVLPENLLQLLRIEDSADCIIISPRQFLGSENFARVMDSIKPLQGEYVSAGRESHFKVPKT